MSRSKLLMLSCLALAVATCAVLYAVGGALGHHEAVAFLRILRDQKTGQDPAGTDRSYEIYKQTQADLLRSPFVMAAALRSPGIRSLPLIESQPSPVQWLAQAVRVEGSPNSEMMEVRMRGSSPEQMTKILDSVVTAYLREVVDRENADARRSLELLVEGCREREQELEETQREYSELAERLPSSDSARGLLQRQLGLRQLERLERRIDRMSDQLVDLRSEVRARQSLAADSDEEVKETELPPIELLNARMEVITESLDELQQQHQQRQEVLLSIEKTSVELDILKQKLEHVKDSLSEFRTLRDRMERRLESSPRVQILQRAMIAS